MEKVCASGSPLLLNWAFEDRDTIRGIKRIMVLGAMVFSFFATLLFFREVRKSAKSGSREVGKLEISDFQTPDFLTFPSTNIEQDIHNILLRNKTNTCNSDFLTIFSARKKSINKYSPGFLTNPHTERHVELYSDFPTFLTSRLSDFHS
jgi:hypothetical protein